MLNIRVTGLFLLITSLCGFSGDRRDLKLETRSQDTSKEIQQLSAGNHSQLGEPFIFVARDVETYALLRTLMESLPKQDPKFFESSAVVAVFLGTRPTGGYSIDISEGADGTIRVAERRPPKGAMVKSVLSAPYKVVTVRTGQNEGLVFSLDELWQAALKSYRVTNGEVTVTGGFAGISKVLKLEGKVDVMRADDLVTFFFDIHGPEKRLLDTASGRVDHSKVVLKRVDSYRLAGAVNSPFRASAEFSDEGRQLSLQLETVPSPHVSDNFGATGSVQASLAK